MPLNDNLPVGSVIIWAGDPTDLPLNWKVCNGKALKKTDYADLFSILGTNWDKDEGFHTDFFNIPDLRGVFLRGVNDDRNDPFADPDVAGRVRLKSDATAAKDAAGSFQFSAIGPHQHDYASPFGSGGDSNSGTGRDATSKEVTKSYTTTGGALARETRPVNAYVYYIIKVKLAP